MIPLSEFGSDLAKGLISAIACEVVVRGELKMDPPWSYLPYLVLIAFFVWMGFLIRAALQRKRNLQYMGFWGCWKRPITAMASFLLLLVVFHH